MNTIMNNERIVFFKTIFELYTRSSAEDENSRTSFSAYESFNNTFRVSNCICTSVALVGKHWFLQSTPIR